MPGYKHPQCSSVAQGALFCRDMEGQNDSFFAGTHRLFFFPEESRYCETQTAAMTARVRQMPQTAQVITECCNEAMWNVLPPGSYCSKLPDGGASMTDYFDRVEVYLTTFVALCSFLYLLYALLYHCLGLELAPPRRNCARLAGWFMTSTGGRFISRSQYREALFGLLVGSLAAVGQQQHGNNLPYTQRFAFGPQGDGHPYVNVPSASSRLSPVSSKDGDAASTASELIDLRVD